MEKITNLQKWVKFSTYGYLRYIYAFNQAEEFAPKGGSWIRIITELPIPEDTLPVYEMLYPSSDFKVLLEIKDSDIGWEIAESLLNQYDSDQCYFKEIYTKEKSFSQISSRWV